MASICTASCLAPDAALALASAFAGDGRASPPARPAHRQRFARLYQPGPDPMRSARPARQWVLEFTPQAKPWIEPLMGWTSSCDVEQHVRLRFRSKEAAQRYALRHGLTLDIEPQAPRTFVPGFARMPAARAAAAQASAGSAIDKERS